MARMSYPKIAHRIYEAIGGSDKNLPPIIFLHAMMASHSHWLTIPARVAGRTKRMVYALDARNHGASGFAESFRFQHNLEDLYIFMDFVKADKSILVGHNMGAMTTISAALEKPEKVEKSFIVDMSVTRFPSIFIERLIAFMKQHGKELESLPATVSKSDLVGTPYENTNTKEMDIMRPIILKRFELLTDALKDYDKSPIVYTGRYDGPSYFIYGSHSPFEVGWEEKEIKKHFPKAEMIRFAGASHNLHKEYPDQFVDTLVGRINE